ncbi:hypothetical protein Esi_0665_0001 [Ectocarpus siliculosus]|uniref:Uncharacterized protein n=1 Tax=Ectocarpus siliculosus TaxID=2880 RepID=D7G5M7_ECTSI|nr:hypothetical protein Esi_0665_0001 [Ectocarpus siliculosus]|eukprot:CBJ33873.1 hypothetical protein Esi_0665_0001 [Ectocarpus siliculosus]
MDVVPLMEGGFVNILVLVSVTNWGLMEKVWEHAEGDSSRDEAVGTPGEEKNFSSCKEKRRNSALARRREEIQLLQGEDEEHGGGRAKASPSLSWGATCCSGISSTRW